MPYLNRKVREVLAEFEGTATSRGQTPEQRQRLRLRLGGLSLPSTGVAARYANWANGPDAP